MNYVLNLLQNSRTLPLVLNAPHAFSLKIKLNYFSLMLDKSIVKVAQQKLSYKLSFAKQFSVKQYDFN